MKLFKTIFLLMGMMISFSSCKKYLDAKPNNALAIPSTLADCQALIDYNSLMNSNCAYIGEGSSDNYYLTDADFNALTQQRLKNLYTWGDELAYDQFPNDWSYSYDKVYTTNTILETISQIERTPKNQADWDNVKGEALFFRASCFLSNVALWAKTYDSSSAATDPGIPLRLNSDFNEVSVRASVKSCYDQILFDLQASISLLPVTPLYAVRPSRTAAYALLSRAYLYTGDFVKAGKYADSALQLKNDLVDYNSLSLTSTAPFARFNPEVIIHFTAITNSIIRNRIDSTLYASYQANDLRKQLYFAKNTDVGYNFKGSYDGSTTLFSGITTDEIYLTRAECYARTGNASAALGDLNTLLRKRWKTGTFVSYTTVNTPDALGLIIQERRKELVMRHLRWADIKRLNAKGAGIGLTRVLSGQTLILPANDKRYALPIPSTVIALSGMQQNPR